MTEHVVKSWKQQGLFEAIYKGYKTHDLRIMDRGYKVGDTLLHQEYDWEAKRYTGRECRTVITYITADGPGHTRCAFSPFVLDRKYGILSIRLVPEPEEDYCAECGGPCARRPRHGEVQL